jgi:hypothetical protein
MDDAGNGSSKTIRGDFMKRLAITAALLLSVTAAQAQLASRIGHTCRKKPRT